MNEEEEKKYYIEVIRRVRPNGLYPKDLAFGKQEAFLEDPARIKAALCTRRAGKSYAGAIFLIEGALETPGSLSPYIALTRDSARTIMWPTLELMNRQLGLGAEMLEARLTMKFKNGSEIFLRGADQKNFIERLRGPKYKRAVIDEAASFSEHIQSLVDDVLYPALADLNGQLALFGTPGPKPHGFFYDITAKRGRIPVHRWSVLDNPFMPNSKQFIADMMQMRGWTDQNPTYRREWLGEWIQDVDSMVYKFDRHRNTVDSIPEDGTEMRILGVDFGYSPDPCAFVIVTFSLHKRITYIEYAEKAGELTVSEIATKIESLQVKYQPAKIVADTGALGKMIAAELTKRHQIPIQSAEKKEKLMNQQIMNGDFIDGRLMVLSTLGDLIHQYEILTKADDGEEDPALPNDLCFIAGTKIECLGGEKNIEDIEVGDLVLTRDGYKPIVRSVCSGEKKIWKLELSNKTVIYGTADHPVWVKNKGFVRLDSLLYADCLYTVGWWLRLRSIGGLLFGAIWEQKTINILQPQFAASRGFYIDMFGRKSAELFLQSIMYTIRTTINQTIGSKIWNAFMEASICRLIKLRKGGLRLPRGSTELGFLPPSGTPLQRALNGIESMLRGGSERTEASCPPPALFANQNTKEMALRHLPSFTAQESVGQKPGENRGSTTSSERVASAKKPSKLVDFLIKKTAVVPVHIGTAGGRARVYQLSVHEKHEYFANGILVRNCDAALYAWRESLSYLSKPKLVKISRDSNEYMAQYEQAEAERLDRKQNGLEFTYEGEDW